MGLGLGRWRVVNDEGQLQQNGDIRSQPGVTSAPHHFEKVECAGLLPVLSFNLISGLASVIDDNCQWRFCRNMYGRENWYPPGYWMAPSPKVTWKAISKSVHQHKNLYPNDMFFDIARVTYQPLRTKQNRCWQLLFLGSDTVATAPPQQPQSNEQFGGGATLSID